ncbi:unnamed protein product [Caenorhabditis angaria]|uniref:NEDD8-activating enzyme E1 regulatory subunit n=1 Tax=Caenorhabditis angaria TaxID=860376 RepID=A0A9P1IGI7_9PELO|nr:unnamed protein product [Caenorhabditis angaria]
MTFSGAEASIRYDRQVRLWGEEGQSSIGATTVCLLGSDSLGTEILKSLVLAGIQSFFIVDDAKVEIADIGQNFFLHIEDVGKNRAEVTLEKLKELNPSVAGFASTISPTQLHETDIGKMCEFSVVVAANQTENIESLYANILWSQGVPLVCAKTSGFLGTIRICVKEHTIANSHEENPRPDMRLDNPFQELVEIINETNLDEMTIDELRHTPYILILFKALEIYRKNRQNPNAFPQSYSDRKEIQSIVLSLRRSSEESGTKDSENFDEAKMAVTRAFQKTEIPSSVQQILNDPNCSTSTEPFWIICEALRRFVDSNNGYLPVRGDLPDMTSDSKRYTRLATIFHEKASIDAKKVLELTREVEKERNLEDLMISEELCYRFCKNADRIRVQRGQSYDVQREIKSIIDLIKHLSIDSENDKSVDGSIWLLLLRAVDRFHNEKGRYPGTNGVPCTIDAFDLTQRVETIVKKAAETQEESIKIMNRIPKNAIDEICRYGAAELHVVSSLIGGITSQEVIKLATNQYVPLENTFVFDGHTQQSTTLKI